MIRRRSPISARIASLWSLSNLRELTHRYRRYSVRGGLNVRSLQTPIGLVIHFGFEIGRLLDHCRRHVRVRSCFCELEKCRYLTRDVPATSHIFPHSVTCSCLKTLQSKNRSG